MRRHAAVGVLLACWAVSASAEAPDVLGERLDRVLQGGALRDARVAALVVDRNDGRELYALAPARALVPASNQKVLTALAALDAFGPAHRFTTRVLADAAPDAEGAVGDLFVRGGGDPALTSEDWWRLAADLRRAGLRRVRGDLVLDDGAFDRERWHPGWGTVGARAYHAPVGALAANYGAFAVEVRPAPRPEQPAAVSVDPPVPFFRLVNRAHTGTAGGRPKLRVDRAAGPTGEQVLVSGFVPAGGEPKLIWRSVSSPALYAGGVLDWQLQANGIRVDGQPRIGTSPAEAHELLAFEGRPLADIVRLFLKFSNNVIAETLVKDLAVRDRGEPGTWTNGMAAMRERLAALGLDLTGARLVDGSGLSRRNRVTPRLLVQALRLGSQSFDFGPELVAGLPIAAADGTLERRAGDAAGAVRAKTGLLDRVTALSGYARLANGREAIFSVLVNGYRASDEEAMRGVDEFVRVLVSTNPAPALAQESRPASSRPAP